MWAKGTEASGNWGLGNSAGECEKGGRQSGTSQP